MAREDGLPCGCITRDVVEAVMSSLSDHDRAVAADARQAQLDEAVAFAREYEDQWGNEPGWFEVAGHLARAEAVDDG